MAVDCIEQGRSLLAKVTGELDHHGAKGVMEALDRSIDLALPGEVTIDLGGLTFTDSSGIAVLLRTWRHVREVGGRMRVINTPDQARRVFDAAGLDRLIPFSGGGEGHDRT